MIELTHAAKAAQSSQPTALRMNFLTYRRSNTRKAVDYQSTKTLRLLIQILTADSCEYGKDDDQWDSIVISRLNGNVGRHCARINYESFQQAQGWGSIRLRA